MYKYPTMLSFFFINIFYLPTTGYRSESRMRFCRLNTIFVARHINIVLYYKRRAFISSKYDDYLTGSTFNIEILHFIIILYILHYY